MNGLIRWSGSLQRVLVFQQIRFVYIRLAQPGHVAGRTMERPGSRVIGRMKSRHIRCKGARMEVDGIARRLAVAYPEANAAHGAAMEGMLDQVVADSRNPGIDRLGSRPAADYRLCKCGQPAAEPRGASPAGDRHPYRAGSFAYTSGRTAASGKRDAGARGWRSRYWTGLGWNQGPAGRGAEQPASR